jgi:hypothetical protein
MVRVRQSTEEVGELGRGEALRVAVVLEVEYSGEKAEE